MSKKLTNSEFLEKCNKVHNNYYNYSKTVYIRNRDNVIIICPIHGEFIKNAAQHLNGKGCNECNYINKFDNYLKGERIKPKRYRALISKATKKSTTKFLKTSKEDKILKLKECLHKDLQLIIPIVFFKKKVLVVDNLGIQYLVQYSDLLKGIFPRIISAINKTEAFKIKLKCISPNLQLIGDYINNSTKVLVKDSLDIIYLNRPSDLLQGNTPTIQTAINKIDCFSKKANVVHNYKYDYNNINYIDAFTKISIFCKEHERYFLQQPSAHLNGQGCPKCVLTTGYSKKQFLEYCAKYNKLYSILYIIECFNLEEGFIKIGITARDIIQRITQFPYSYVILKEIKGSPDFIYDKEKELHELCKKFTYSPLIEFGGHTECFTLGCKKIIEDFFVESIPHFSIKSDISLIPCEFNSFFI